MDMPKALKTFEDNVGLNIKNREAHQIAEELSKLTGSFGNRQGLRTAAEGTVPLRR